MNGLLAGGKCVIVPKEKLLPEMHEDRFFLPGIIHSGKDYLINVYLHDNEEDEPDQFEVNYFTKGLILKAAQHDPSLGDNFWQYLICECETFECENDASGEFAALIEKWPDSIYMTHSELAEWARKKEKVRMSERDNLEVGLYLLGKITDYTYDNSGGVDEVLREICNNLKYEADLFDYSSHQKKEKETQTNDVSKVIEDIKYALFDDKEYDHGFNFETWTGDGESFVLSNDKKKFRVIVREEEC